MTDYPTGYYEHDHESFHCEWPGIFIRVKSSAQRGNKTTEKQRMEAERLQDSKESTVMLPQRTC